MIGILYSWEDRKTGELVLTAMRRSVTTSGASRIASGDIAKNDFILAINPDEYLGEKLLVWLSEGARKLILFGRLPDNLLNHFKIVPAAWPEPTEDWARSPAALSGQFAESKASIHYSPSALALKTSDWDRALERFDFTDEWNNLGFGAVRAEGSIWSIASACHAPESAELARIQTREHVITSYSALFEEPKTSVLWVNREVGLIDSYEWRLIEAFISNWRHDVLPCLPVLSEIPFGYDAAITMRLDCDEDIASVQQLWEAYQQADVPLSLALHTNILPNEKHEKFLKTFIETGGAVLSHTATHAPNWGGSYEAAHWEGVESRAKIENATGINVKYAVSPFHQSPEYALAALCDAGYLGCIGGIIRNDPEFLIARGGELAHLPAGFVGHSQQSMLHGDCMLTDGDPLTIFKQAFDRAVETRTLFGYLDHPFSERYQYGWSDEKTRVTAHLNFIKYMREQSAQPLFLDECQTLDFLRARAAIQFTFSSRHQIASVPVTCNGLRFAAEFRGLLYEITDGAVLS